MKEIKLIVAGGRDFNDYEKLHQVLHQLAEDTYKDYFVSIVSGMAKGADALGYQFARQHNIQLYEFHADWNLYGKGAGFRRNGQMGVFADVLLAFWDGKSKGTKHMIDLMHALNKPVHIIRY